jgi:hypothetical protein
MPFGVYMYISDPNNLIYTMPNAVRCCAKTAFDIKDNNYDYFEISKRLLFHVLMDILGFMLSFTEGQCKSNKSM